MFQPEGRSQHRTPEPGLIAGPALVEAAGRECSTVQMPLIAAPDQIVGIRGIDSFSYGETNYSSYDQLFAHTTFTHTKNPGRSVFVHYLAAALGELDTAPDTDYGHRNVLLEHRNLIVENLQQADEHVRSKYVWLARYHNWFCDENISTINKSSNDLRVPESKIGSDPDLISFQSLKDYAASLEPL
ncbi:hypothetical protein HF877_21005 [Rhodococcus sp. BL-253-APC-6A1W]|uniref:hypothetical protein n=1 Tax=Rhodococcus sp. BL-253-APC-6A1W TaxID=2725307 RepID=UPI00146C62EB|nr:hypothetical protein [Rhodococcus sp. BL-253-APC-6A1W]NMD97850.1 hypothetical protein [Rhodococcus sp. BL-253-APC-6A1W]